MPSRKHVHKYHKITFGRNKVWACALQDICSHHLPVHMENMIYGRKSICWECESEFILDEISTSQDRPKCKDCRGVGSIDSILEQKLAGK